MAKQIPAIMIPLSKKAISAFRAISGLDEVKYIYLMIIYSEIGIVNIAMYSLKLTVSGSSKLNFRIKYNE